jgi:hypothetical protein
MCYFEVDIYVVGLTNSNEDGVVGFFAGQREYFGFHQSEKGESRNEVQSGPD